jgi:hypothetical protein
VSINNLTGLTDESVSILGTAEDFFWSIILQTFCGTHWTVDERKTNLMQLLYMFIVAVGDALHVSGVFAHRQER